MSWETLRLDDVCSLITDGKHGDCTNQSNSGYYFVSAKDIYNWNIFYDEARQITKEDFEDTNRRTQFEPFDVTMVSTGANIGRIAVAKDEEITYRTTFQKSVALLKPIKSKVIPHYLAYFLKYSNEQIHSMSSGSAQKNVLLKDLRAFKITLPPLPTQKKIASILSAYDDLIENNLKRIKLLEEAAQNIYKEWFINLRFPGWENAKFDKERGLPEGWRIQDASLICDIKIGKTPPRKESKWFSKSEGTKWCSISDMNQSTIFLLETKERITNDGVSIFNMNLAGKGTVILSFKLTIGAVAITSEDIVTNEAIAHFNIKPNESITKEFIYCYLKNFNFDILGSTSSIGMALNSNIVKAMPILNPNMKIIETFTRSTSNIFSQINNLLLQNQKLKEARDILLPRLMNQTINV